MSGEKQMPDWLRKKLATAQNANNIYMSWCTSSKAADEFLGEETPKEEDKKKINDVVQWAFALAEGFDSFMEEYLKAPPEEEKSKLILTGPTTVN